jgi:hypothetical protein
MMGAPLELGLDLLQVFGHWFLKEARQGSCHSLDTSGLMLGKSVQSLFLLA